MCGRFGLEPEYVQLALRYQAAVDAIDDPGPRYNIAPTQPIAVILENERGRLLTEARWGFVPSWVQDPSLINRAVINARAETAATRPLFRAAFKKRRCVIPASRFYEWKRTNSRKVPYSIQRDDGSPMNLAGLWASPDDATGRGLRTCAIITTAANRMMGPIHERMPAILPDELVDRWLDPELSDPAKLQPLLLPYRAQDLSADPISDLVNSPRNQGPELVEPLEPSRKAA